MYVQSIYMWRDSSELRLVTFRRRRHAHALGRFVKGFFCFAVSIARTRLVTLCETFKFRCMFCWWKRWFNCENAREKCTSAECNHVEQHSNDCTRPNCDIFAFCFYAKGNSYAANQTKQTANKCIFKSFVALFRTSRLLRLASAPEKMRLYFSKWQLNLRVCTFPLSCMHQSEFLLSSNRRRCWKPTYIVAFSMMHT